MEIETKNGSKIRLQEPSDTVDFGRGLGFNSSDQTVSRRHISFKLHNNQTSVYFEVKGKNPVWVHHSTNDKIRVYKRSETGELKSGDSFCVSSKNPVWFNLKKIASEDEDDDSESKGKFDDALAESSGSGVDYEEIESVDVSHIDPVTEFNFIVMGHEFDSYPKNKIRDIRNWDWFLDEAKEESDEDETNERKPKRGISKKRKKGRGKDDDDDDDVWTGESEEDAEMIKKLKNVQKPKYSTRSKNQEKNKKGSGASKSAKDATQRYAKDDDDDDDEMLGGFIVDDEDIREGNDEDEDEDDEEEEEFEEDEDDD